eukprot:UN33476
MENLFDDNDLDISGKDIFENLDVTSSKIRKKFKHKNRSESLIRAKPRPLSYQYEGGGENNNISLNETSRSRNMDDSLFQENQSVFDDLKLPNPKSRRGPGFQKTLDELKTATFNILNNAKNN